LLLGIGHLEGLERGWPRAPDWKYVYPRRLFISLEEPIDEWMWWAVF
jgi:hypothetical protein